MQKFINPPNVIAETGLKNGQVVADLGCGSGFYSIPSAQIVGNSGKVYAVDIQESKLAYTQSTAHQIGYKNVVTITANLEQPLEEIPEGSCDLVIVASILHEIGDRKPLLTNAYKILKTGGKLLAVEWKKGFTVFGPAQDRRISQEDLEQFILGFGFRKHQDLDADDFHYALTFIK